MLTHDTGSAFAVVADREAATADTSCRLCSARTAHRFSKRVLSKYDVSYYECTECRSLQTEIPHWLHEAYGSNLADIDTGAAQRNLNSMAATLAVCKLFTLRDVVDFGGGDGLLCRLLRDHGINCYVQDRYARTTYALGFTEPNFHRPDMRLSFEVFEHFSEPKADLASIFSDGPESVFGSTVCYSGQGPEWEYLASEAGQHVFFYSSKALMLIGKNYGYDVFLKGCFFLFIKKNRPNKFQFLLLRALLRGPSLRMLRTLISALPTRGASVDKAEMAHRRPR